MIFVDAAKIGKKQIRRQKRMDLLFINDPQMYNIYLKQ